MKPVYTIDDFQTRQGRLAFAQTNVDYELLNRMEPANPDSPADQLNAQADKARFNMAMSVYRGHGIRPQQDIELPSGKKFTVEELARLEEEEAKKSYLDVHHEFERAFATRRSIQEIAEILEGRQQIDVPDFRGALEFFPVEATLVRLERHNPTISLDDEIYDGMRNLALRTLSLTEYNDHQGNTRPVPLIGIETGPRPKRLTTEQLQTLLGVWDALDASEQDIFNIFQEKFGVGPTHKPN